MNDDYSSDPLLDEIRSVIRLHRGQMITAAELINAVFLLLGQLERYDLAADVARLVPASAHEELRRVLDVVLRQGAAYTPFTIGRPLKPDEWRQRMIPACQKLAALLRQWLDASEGGPSSTALV